jgi:DnaK suppressor protein
MTRTETNNYRKRLEEMVRRLGGLRREMRSDNAFQEHSEDDLSRMHIDEEVAVSLLDTEEGLLGDCQAALRRLEEETFGTCEICGHTIAKDRLAAVPHTRYCIRCARVRAINAESVGHR